MLGLCGDDPVTFDVNNITPKINDIAQMKKLILHGLHEIDFDPREDIEFLSAEVLPFHPNAITFLATFKNGDNIAETYYSIGGGFVIREGETNGRSVLLCNCLFPLIRPMICCIGAGKLAWHQ